MKLGEAKRRYRGHWLAFHVSKRMAKGDYEGRVLAHAKDRQALHQILKKRHVRAAYLTFAGPVLRPGYTTLFPCKSR